jgi:uncharacterized protein
MPPLADARFVSLTTFRRSGAPVATPVWIAADPDGAGLLVTTPRESGKVKRLRRDPRVQLRPCDRRGKVEADAPRTDGTAELVPYDARLEGIFKRKYGLEYRVFMVAERLFARGNKDRVALRITALSPS